MHSLHMNNQLTTTTPKIKLSEMGSTGLVQYVVNGSRRMRGARKGQAMKIIVKRYNKFANCCAFTDACNAAIERGYSKS